MILKLVFVLVIKVLNKIMDVSKFFVEKVEIVILIRENGKIVIRVFK